VKPEAVCFTAIDGKRAGLIGRGLAGSAWHGSSCEAVLPGLHADVEFLPDMSPANLDAAGPYFERVLREYVS
jgi:hypothetical protein